MHACASNKQFKLEYYAVETLYTSNHGDYLWKYVSDALIIWHCCMAAAVVEKPDMLPTFSLRVF